jgi:hypothetical protein
MPVELEMLAHNWYQMSIPMYNIVSGLYPLAAYARHLVCNLTVWSAQTNSGQMHLS